MKQMMMVFLALAWTLSTASAYAWKETAPTQKEYTFKFIMAAGKAAGGPSSYEVRRVAASYEEAFDSAAQQCFQFFKGGKRVSEDRGLDIIDTCANPRS